MRSDALLSFIPIGGNLSVTGSSDVASTNTIDLLGQGVGTAPVNFIGTASLFGTDMGIGGFRPEINIVTGTSAFVGTSLQIKLQGAVDTASTYQPGTWITFAETAAILSANLPASTVVARFPWLPAWPAGTLPRYLRLLFTPVSITTGVIASAIVTTGRDDMAQKYSAKNFVVA